MRLNLFLIAGLRIVQSSFGTKVHNGEAKKMLIFLRNEVGFIIILI